MMVLDLNSKTGNAMTVIGNTSFIWAEISEFKMLRGYNQKIFRNERLLGETER